MISSVRLQVSSLPRLAAGVGAVNVISALGPMLRARARQRDQGGLMTPVILGLGLAVVGSVALNGSYLLQHAGSRAVPAIALLRPVSTLAGLLRSRWWLVGAGVGLLGSVLHVAALAQAPLSLVQRLRPAASR